METEKKITAPRANKKPPPDIGDVALASLVLRRFRVVFNAIKSHFRQIEKDTGIGGAQLWALSVIESTPGIGVNDLARAMDIHQSTASNLVKSLLERKMVATIKSDVDRRVVALNILPDGLEILRKAPGPLSGLLPDALASLDAKTLARLDKDLGKLILLIHADDQAEHTPLADL